MNRSAFSRLPRRWLRPAAALVLVATAVLCLPLPSSAYSVLSHEQVVDQCWKDTIVPMLQARFPALTPEQIAEAHSYAYGGSVLQDIGYYPHGSQFMSDLMHYVRSGDFVTALLRDAQTPDEVAFAIGALAHYTGDVYGHPTVNRVTALQNPKLAAKYGPVVTYDQDHIAHVRTEFGFEVVEVANGKYQGDAYRDFIGFRVCEDLLNRAFLETYGLAVPSLVNNEDRAIATYRHDVAHVIPEATRIAWVSYRKQIVAADGSATSRRFEYRLNHTAYEREWGKGYQEPSRKEAFLAFIVRLLPKVGPLRVLKLHVSDAAEQDMYKKSMLSTEDHLRTSLKDLAASGPRYSGFQLTAINLDTGDVTAPGAYRLTDQTYAKLLGGLTATGVAPAPEAMRSGVLAFFATNAAEKDIAPKDPAQWTHVQQEIAILRAQDTAAKAF